MFDPGSIPIDTIPYSMQPNKEGYIGNAIVFVNTQLIGSCHDQNNLRAFTKLLGFECHVFPDLTQRQYHDTLYYITNPPSEKAPGISEEVWRARILPEHEAIFIAVVSHGNKDCFLTADGKLFPDSHITLYLNENKCTLMRGKPKVIFFNKCRTDGTGGNGGVSTVQQQQTARVLSVGGEMDYETYLGGDSSTHSNFLHINSCSKGTYSLRRIDIGSFVISRLPGEFEKYGIGKEFRKFIQLFRSRMISEINMMVKNSPGFAGVTQCVTTECDTLLRDVYFPQAPCSESLEEMEVEQSHEMAVCEKNNLEVPNICLNTSKLKNRDSCWKRRLLKRKRKKKSKKYHPVSKQGAQKSLLRWLYDLNCLKV